MATSELKARTSRENGKKCKKYNEYFIKNGIAYVTLNNTKNVMLCDEDIWVKWKMYSWIENTVNGYVETNVNGKRLKFHYVVLVDHGHKLVRDHINRNKLDNRQENLRWVTNHANTVNTKLNKNNKSGVKGVRYCKGKWIAYIFFNYKSIYLGTYDNKLDAVKARKEAEDIYFKPLFYNRV
jgi:hypothetical protein